MNAKDLIPEYWDLPVAEKKDIVFLGRITVERLVSYWRSTLKSHDERVRKMEERLHLLQDNDVVSLREVATGFENPTDIVAGVNKNGWGSGGDREPLDRASLERESDTTTLNICGWCKHASGGLARYSFYIKTQCSFEKDAEMGTYGDRVFDSPCFIQTTDDRGLTLLRISIAGKLDELRVERHAIGKKLRTLLSLLRETEDKPALPSHRPHDWFNVDDPVVCYVGGWPDDAKSKKLTSAELVTARVIDGYRHHDGCVSVRYNDRVHSDDYLDGHGGGYGNGRPEIMHPWELDYLRANPAFAILYATLGTGKHMSNFHPTLFLGTIKRGTLTES